MIKQRILITYFVTIINKHTKRYTNKNMACVFLFELSIPAASKGYAVTSRRRS